MRVHVISCVYGVMPSVYVIPCAYDVISSMQGVIPCVYAIILYTIPYCVLM